MKQRGPKKKEYDKKVIKELILSFNKDSNHKGIIKYVDIYEYSQKMFAEDKFPYNTSYDFWKREGRIGRELVDDYNKVKTKNLISTDNKQIDIVDVADVLEKMVSDEKVKLQLGKYLLPLEKQIRKFAIQLESKNHKIQELENDVRDLNIIKEQLTNQVNILQESLYKMFLYSNSDNELTNLINTGKSKSYPVNKALEEAFGSPMDFFMEMEQTRVKKESGNVVELKMKEDKNNFLDDFDI